MQAGCVELCLHQGALLGVLCCGLLLCVAVLIGPCAVQDAPWTGSNTDNGRSGVPALQLGASVRLTQGRYTVLGPGGIQHSRPQRRGGRGYSNRVNRPQRRGLQQSSYDALASKSAGKRKALSNGTHSSPQRAIST